MAKETIDVVTESCKENERETVIHVIYAENMKTYTESSRENILQCTLQEKLPEAVKTRPKKLNLPVPPGGFKLPLKADAVTQTELSDFSLGSIWDDSSCQMNIFFCTFHPSLNVETYCNILPAVRKGCYPEGEEGDISFENYCNSSYYKPSVTQKSFDKLEEGKISSQSWKCYNQRESSLSEYNVEDQICKSESKNDKCSKRINKLHRPLKNTKHPTHRPILKCIHCTEEFTTFFKLKKHCKLFHNLSEFSFPCNLCGSTFSTPFNLERHKGTRHNTQTRKFSCEYCGSSFSRNDVLINHKFLRHTSRSNINGEKAPSTVKCYQCRFCHKPFRRIQNYNNHLRGYLTCSVCCKSFNCKTELKIHANKQHSVVCDFCGKECSNNQQFNAHKLTHYPKYICEFCNKGFVWKSCLIVHLATHTGVKSSGCEICGKLFAHQNAVNKHKWHEHDEVNRKYHCKICNKKFAIKSKLDSHMRVHTGEKPFACHVCPCTFSHKCNLLAHVKSRHGIYLQTRLDHNNDKGLLVSNQQAVTSYNICSENIQSKVTETEDCGNLKSEACSNYTKTFGSSKACDSINTNDALPLHQVLNIHPP